MKRLGLAAICCLGLLPLAVTAGPITYDVNFSSSGETVTGSITTDGTLGSITLADITAWSFDVTGSPLTFSIASTDAGALEVCSFGSCSFVATATTLSFDFGAAQIATFFVFGGPFSTVDSIAFLGTTPFSPDAVIHLAEHAGEDVGTAFDIPFPAGAEVIGRVSGTAPEPATVALLGIGLAGLGFSRRKRKQ